MFHCVPFVTNPMCLVFLLSVLVTCVIPAVILVWKRNVKMCLSEDVCRGTDGG